MLVSLVGRYESRCSSLRGSNVDHNQLVTLFLVHVCFKFIEGFREGTRSWCFDLHVHSFVLLLIDGLIEELMGDFG